MKVNLIFNSLILCLLLTYQCVANGATYGVVGDVGFVGREAEDLRRSLQRSKVRSMILPGDNLYDTEAETYASVWSPWRKLGFEFPIVAIGNHHSSYEEEVAYFGIPGEVYAKREGESLFVVLNSDHDETGPTQAAWLRAQLEAANSRFLFVVFHHPPVSILHGWQERARFQLSIRPVLQEFRDKITALLVGHDHLAGLFEIDGLPMVLSGAGIEAFDSRRVEEHQDGRKVVTRWTYNASRTWARLDIGEKEVWVNFVDIPRDKVSCSALISARPIQLRANCD